MAFQRDRDVILGVLKKISAENGTVAKLPNHPSSNANSLGSDVSLVVTWLRRQLLYLIVSSYFDLVFLLHVV